MNIDTFREYCISKKGTSEDFPFDETTLVFRVMGKIFALTDIENLPFSFNLKCVVFANIMIGFYWATARMSGGQPNYIMFPIIFVSNKGCNDKSK